MRVLLVPVGSAGDVHPFVGIGQTLRQRGHEVIVLANAYFEEMIGRAGLQFFQVGTLDEYHAVTANPNLWHPRKGATVVLKWGGLQLMRAMYAAVAEKHEAGNTVVVAGGLALGARIAQETLEFPMATIHLQPFGIWSEHRPPISPGGFDLRRLPQPLLRLLYRGAVAWMDLICAKKINQFRVSLGLQSRKRLMGQWWNAPHRIIGLFPEWYAGYQPDWPQRVRLTGFPLFDERNDEALPDDLRAFLEAGGDPVVFTPGSAMRHGEDFFRAAAGACERLGRRGILLTRFPEQLPSSLPPTIRHFDYAPFSQLLPLSAAMVHHGGVGTVAQALHAGIPQLIMPMGFDQPDNASRLRELGVAEMLPRRAFKEENVAAKLSGLLNSDDVASRCRTISQRFHDTDPVGDTCKLIEELDPQTVFA